MCGIGGILRTDGQPIPEEWLDIIDARIAYRGPDGHGRFRDRVEIDDPSAPNGKRVVEVAFVHRRLSIIDHKDGAQPMVSPRGRNDSEGLVAVVFNGCIYNHRELRRELESKGHRFVTDHSDTEVLIHGWREWEDRLIRHLEGMYAFAIWDRATTSICLARDLFGEKPLYCRDSVASDGPIQPIAFSSSRSALCSVALELHNAVRAKTYVAGYLQSGCGWGDVMRSVPGQQISTPRQNIYRPIGPSYYGGTPISDLKKADVNAALIEQLLETAVQSRLEADVALGCFLSGGIDSSLVAMFANKHAPPLHTFSVRMPDQRFDESALAERVAKQIGVIHQTLDAVVDPSDDLMTLVDLLGQPFGDSSILPTFWVSRAAREHVKVALTGDGGDELFIGYDRYLAARALGKWPGLLSHLPPILHRRAHPKSWRSKFARLGDMARDFEFIGIRAMESVFSQHEIAELVGDAVELPLPANPATFLPSQMRAVVDAIADATGNIDRSKPLEHERDDYLTQLRKIDILEYLPNDLLTKVDTASMACGLEVRCPFLDRDLARAALSAPIEQLMPRGQRKGLLRQIARKYLPKEIVDRPKMGFAIPIGEWFRDDDLPHKGSGMKTLLLDHLNSAEPFGPIQLNRKAVQRFIDEHTSCKRDHGQRLFTLLTLSIWARSLKETHKSTNAQTRT
jgi:asparagine synthase (glutamine-hydrolysing)